MNEYNLSSYYNDAFGIDSADDVVVSSIDLDSLDSSIDVDLEASYH